MADTSRVHDRLILDALESIAPESYKGDVWRITRQDRDPLRGSGANGRWSAAGEFEALYTSLTRDGALAEIGYRLSLEPIWPSRLHHVIHTIHVQTERTLRFANLDRLAPLGVDIERYQTFEYGATQALAAAAHFLEFDGLIVPSARAACLNLVLFLDRGGEQFQMKLLQTEQFDWTAWRRQVK